MLKAFFSFLNAKKQLNTDTGILYFPDVKHNYYRPQTKFAKVMFLHLSVSHSVYKGDLHQGRESVSRGRSASRGFKRTPSTNRILTTKYGQRVCGTHPTGMHACFFVCLILKSYLIFRACIWKSSFTTLKVDMMNYGYMMGKVNNNCKAKETIQFRY